MDKQLAAIFFQEASKAFTLVVTEYGFAAPQLEVNDEIHFAFVTFMGRNLAIECSLDGREGDVRCVVARVEGGGRATYRDAVDERDEHGVRVREGLSRLLRRRGVRERLFTRLDDLEVHERMKVTLADFAQMLRKHGQAILDDSPTALS